MATYDLLMLAVLIGLTLYGYFKGMAWQIAYIASFVLSYFVAVRFADRVAPSITFVNPPVNKFVAMLLIYIVCSFAVWMVFRIVSNMIDRVKMEGFDHQMGALVGFFRGVLWCIAITFFAVTLLPDAQKRQIIGSRSGHYIARLVDKTDSIFPPEVHQVIGPYLDRLGNELNQQVPPAQQQPGGWGGQQGGWSQSQTQQPQQPVNWQQQANQWQQQASNWAQQNLQQSAQQTINQAFNGQNGTQNTGGGWPTTTQQNGGWPASNTQASPPAPNSQPNNWPQWP